MCCIIVGYLKSTLVLAELNLLQLLLLMVTNTGIFNCCSLPYLSTRSKCITCPLCGIARPILLRVFKLKVCIMLWRYNSDVQNYPFNAVLELAKFYLN